MTEQPNPFYNIYHRVLPPGHPHNPNKQRGHMMQTILLFTINDNMECRLEKRVLLLDAEVDVANARLIEIRRETNAMELRRAFLKVLAEGYFNLVVHGQPTRVRIETLRPAPTIETKKSKPEA